MEGSRPRVSRETRLLLAIILLSISTLWVLARIRFPNRVAAPNPISPVLAQFVRPSALEEIADTVARLGPHLQLSLAALEVRGNSGDAAPVTRTLALRIRDDLVVALTNRPRGITEDVVTDATEVVRDPASHLAVLRVPNMPAPALSTWSPRRLQSPYFLIASDDSQGSVTFRPVWVGSLTAIASPVWRGSIWALPPFSSLKPGSFVFTVDGALVGLVIDREGGSAIVPGEIVMTLADRLRQEGPRQYGWLGIEAQRLTPRVAVATGGTGGVVVTWVDPYGPAAGDIRVADVIEEFGGEAVSGFEQWQALISRVQHGASVSFKVRRGPEIREIRLTAAASPPAPRDGSLGLTLRWIRRTGAEVLRIIPNSAAAIAKLEVGDVITMVAGEIAAPTPAQVKHAFSSTPENRPLLLGVTRGNQHSITTVERTP